MDCFADVPYSSIVEIELEQSTYYVVLFDFLNPHKPVSSRDTSDYSRSKIAFLKELFSRKDLTRYGDAIRVYKNIVHVPLGKIWPTYANATGIFPIDVCTDFPLNKLPEATIARWFRGNTAEEACTSPLTKNDEYWLAEYPLEIILEIENEIDYVFIGIEGGLTSAELQSIIERANTASDLIKGVDQDAMRILAEEIHSKHVIVLEYWHY